MDQFIHLIINFLQITQAGPILIAAIATVFAGGVSSYISKWILQLRIREASGEADLDALAKTVRAQASEARARAVEAVVEKLPPGISSEEIKKTVESQIRVGGDLIINTADNGERQLVEDLVTTYHQQALSQAKVQFWFSVLAATVGFLYILYGASSSDPANLLTLSKILPGVVIDAIAVLFFRQAEQTRQRATELYDRLRTDRQMMRAETVVASIEDESIRSAVKAQIALHMVGLAPKEIDLQSFLSKKERSAHRHPTQSRFDQKIGDGPIE